MKLLEIGKIVKTQGLKGRVKVLSYLQSQGASLQASLDQVFVGNEGYSPRSFDTRYFQAKGNCFFLELEGIEDISQAETLVGLPVFVSNDCLASLAEGEYYWQDLIGLDVVTEEGEPLGKVAEIFPTGSNDVFVCRCGDEEVLIPAIEEVIRQVDLEKGEIRVRLLEGL